MATEAMQIANLTFHSADISDRRATIVCALDVFARHTSSRITFLTLTIVGRSRGDVSSRQDVFQTFGFPEGQDGWFFEDFTQFWVFLYGCPVLTNDAG
jgi:hypothetical protein